MGIPISGLPSIVTPALSDVFPVNQGGVTYKETFTQLSSLFATAGANSNITSLTGTATNDNAAAGKIGEVISSQILLADAVAILDATDTNVTSISLTAGDWNVWGNVTFVKAGGGSFTTAYAWCSSTSATLPNASLYNSVQATLDGAGINTPYIRISIASTTTVYLSARCNFAAGTASICGGINARRAR